MKRKSTAYRFERSSEVLWGDSDWSGAYRTGVIMANFPWESAAVAVLFASVWFVFGLRVADYLIETLWPVPIAFALALCWLEQCVKSARVTDVAVVRRTGLFGRRIRSVRLIDIETVEAWIPPLHSRDGDLRIRMKDDMVILSGLRNVEECRAAILERKAECDKRRAR